MERWQQIESLFQEALQRDPAERDAYVREACRGDSVLRREVASLLANHDEASRSEPWAAAAAAQLISGLPVLKAGHRLGPRRRRAWRDQGVSPLTKRDSINSLGGSERRGGRPW